MKMEGVSKSQWKFKITETLFNVFRGRSLTAGLTFEPAEVF
ncbi:MAG: hypothetical protein ACTS44_00615 [Candidatus Hodgkinia cicadicola]